MTSDITGSNMDTVVLTSVHQVDMYKALHTVINHLQLLWELVLLGEAIPSARPFSIEEFLLTVDAAGPSLTCGVKGLYRRFVSSPNFVGWLSSRTRDVNAQLKAQYVEALCSADLGAKVLATKHHVEIVDLVLRVRQRIIEMEEASEKRHQLYRNQATMKTACKFDDEI
ncbi:hypothetical protein TELCIR_11311 [Teladorsagia circumcincta]|uniref:Uncharacterized protein n=1 Tax=Teladorsagia circumcincta TaxID=45464 RepID=A0A2G9U9L5_TELCI|nr:hypothetical protein TELCIR_11311 [Teladorsagia circumcincta]